MGIEALEIVDGRAVGVWIEPELSTDIGSVASTVPDRFEAFVRILHPAHDGNGEPVPWSDVAAATGRKMHPLVQWDALADAGSEGEKQVEWTGGRPDMGVLPLDLFESLCELLAGHTRQPLRCYFGVWAGHYVPQWAIGSRGSSAVEPRWEPLWPRMTLGLLAQAEDPERQYLSLPPTTGRDYVVFSGSLAAAPMLPDLLDITHFFPTTPSMMWPADRAWYLASELDFDSTLIGGSRELVGEILESPTFEAFAVAPGDSLRWDGDRVNPLPASEA